LEKLTLNEENPLGELGKCIALVPQLLARMDTLEQYLARIEERICAKPDRPKRYFNIKETARELNMSVTSVRRLIERNLLNKSAGTRKIQIPAEEIESYRSRTVV
jgi:AraC-like DNA-binding protein